MSDYVQVTLQIPGWAFKFLDTLDDLDFCDYSDRLDKVEGSDRGEHGKPDEVYYDPAYGHTWTFIIQGARQANAEIEKTFDKYHIPYDKWYEAGIEVEAGREWVRYDAEGNRLHRDIINTDHFNYQQMFDERDRQIASSDIDGFEAYANKRFINHLRSWWEAHKPLEPPLAECTPDKFFLEVSKTEA